jgi:sporulation protein YlmC with PRC-barrel domain
MGQDVFGPNGNQMGEVQEIFVDAEGRATAIIVEAGGFSTLATLRSACPGAR